MGLNRVRGNAATTATKAKSTKIAAVVDNATKKNVDEIISLKARIKADSAALGVKEGAVIDVVRAQQDEKASVGQYSKSFTVPGNTSSLTYVTADRFSVPQFKPSTEPDAVDANGNPVPTEELAALKALCAERYTQLFEEKETLAIRPTILSDETQLDAILDACEAAGLDLNAIFERTVKVVAKDGLDEKQYQLGDALPQFRTFARQSKPSLR